MLVVLREIRDVWLAGQGEAGQARGRRAVYTRTPSFRGHRRDRVSSSSSSSSNKTQRATAWYPRLKPSHLSGPWLASYHPSLNCRPVALVLVLVLVVAAARQARGQSQKLLASLSLRSPRTCTSIDVVSMASVTWKRRERKSLIVEASNWRCFEVINQGLSTR